MAGLWNTLGHTVVQEPKDTGKGPEWKATGDYQPTYGASFAASFYSRRRRRSRCVWASLSLKSSRVSNVSTRRLSPSEGHVSLRRTAVISKAVDRQQGAPVTSGSTAR